MQVDADLSFTGLDASSTPYDSHDGHFLENGQ